MEVYISKIKNVAQMSKPMKVKVKYVATFQGIYIDRNLRNSSKMPNWYPDF